jgi:glutathione S-transferase
MKPAAGSAAEQAMVTIIVRRRRQMLVLYQAEWCPYSHRVRMRLTALGLEWLARPVSVDHAGRDAMEVMAGTRSIPTLIDGGTIVVGANQIIAYLDGKYPEPPNSRIHAETLEQREWPHWLELHGSSRRKHGEESQ